MTWYYASDGKQVGPLSDTELAQRVEAGTVGADTLVWREGMAAWTPYAQVAAPAARAAEETTCSQCGKPFPASEVIRYGDLAVCAACKPAFVQRIQEGAAVPGQFAYGGFWIRFAARLLDGLMLGAVNLLLSVPMFVLTASQHSAQTGPSPAFIGLTCLTYLLQFAVGAGYEIFFVGKYGATLGKRACGLRVVMADGRPMTFGRAGLRYLGTLLSGLTLGIGYVIAAFDDEKRALHDHVCGTRVVRV